MFCFSFMKSNRRSSANLRKKSVSFIVVVWLRMNRPTDLWSPEYQTRVKYNIKETTIMLFPQITNLQLPCHLRFLLLLRKDYFEKRTNDVLNSNIRKIDTKKL